MMGRRKGGNGRSIDEYRAILAAGTTRPLPTKLERFLERSRAKKCNEDKARPQSARKAYSKRNKLVRSLGFDSYENYLKSGLWMRIRARVLKRSKICHVCGDEATQVHHGRYSHRELTGESIRHLYSICKPCHERIEFTEGGIKLGPKMATDKLEDLRCEMIREQETYSDGR